MRRWLFLFLVITLFGSMQVLAQDEERFFGLRGDALISYALDGSTNELIGNIKAETARLLKTKDPEQPLLVAELDGTIGLYLVGQVQQPQAIILAEGLILEDTNWIILSRHHPYYILQSPAGKPESLGILINTDTLEAQPLGIIPYLREQKAAFSEDGTKLRYVRKDTDNNNQWYLVERELATGTETIFYTVDASYPILNYDRYGEHWLLYIRADQNEISITYLIQPDGTTTEIAREDKDEYKNRIIWDDQLYTVDASCKTDCPIKISPLDDDGTGSVITFITPTVQSFPHPLTMPNAEQLIVVDSSGYWLLNINRTSEYLGIVDPLVDPITQILSDDKRWLMTIMKSAPFAKERDFQIRDLQNGQTVLEGSTTQSFMKVTFDDEGIIIWEIEGKNTLYRFSDGEIFTIDISGHEALFALATPNIGLVSVSDKSIVGESGIYTYNFDAENLQVLVADVHPLTPF